MSHHQGGRASMGEGCQAHYLNPLNVKRKLKERRAVAPVRNRWKYPLFLFLMSGLLFGITSIGSAYSIFPETATAGFSKPLFTGNENYTIDIPEYETPRFQLNAFWDTPPEETFLTGISAYSDRASDMNIFGDNVQRKSAPAPNSLLLLCSGLAGLTYFVKNTRCPDRLIVKWS